MDRSRKIYLWKLIEEFPDEPELGLYYIRDFIAPRFVRTYLGLYISAIREGKTASSPEYYQDEIAALLPYLGRRKLLLYLVAYLPVPVARALRNLWRCVPNWVQSQLWRLD